MKKLVLIVLLLALCLTGMRGNVWARNGQDKKAAGQKIDRKDGSGQGDPWQQLDPAQRQELRQRYRQFQNLPAAEQQKIRQRYERFQEMSPENKQRVLERHRRLQQLPPERREELHREWLRTKQLPEEERERQRQKLQKKYFNGNSGR